MVESWSRVVSASKPVVFGDRGSGEGILELNRCCLMLIGEGGLAAGRGPTLYCSQGEGSARLALARLTQACPCSRVQGRFSSHAGPVTLSVAGGGKVLVTGVVHCDEGGQGAEAAAEAPSEVDEEARRAKEKLERVRKQIAALEARRASMADRPDREAPAAKRARRATESAAAEAPSAAGRAKGSREVASIDLGLARPQAKQKPREESAKAEIRTLSSGLGVQITKPGRGAAAKSGQVLHVRYEGRLAKTAECFDKGFIKFRLGMGKVIRGWDEGFPGMQAAEKRTLFVPARLGYGAKGAPPEIPPNADLVFRVELLGILQ
eukprot:TRINITY_DN30557_c0_g1_i1.p1 TRINITY_DN30557_c0_g1~~TRINITY_DN30557_c0_g1_i1.p1  ORF type:complete len:343 (+),score=53.71 TRINITY_DN30557_c0_g1_i1:68-1030(+)